MCSEEPQDFQNRQRRKNDLAHPHPKRGLFAGSAVNGYGLLLLKATEVTMHRALSIIFLILTTY